MPEGDTVFRAARTLDAALRGKRIVECELRTPSLATSDLSGQVVTGVAPRGKHLLMRTDHDLTLHSHLKMEGSWHIYRKGERWRGGPSHEVRAVIATEEWVAVGYRLGILELLKTTDEPSAVGHLGPDILSKDWDLDEALGRMALRPERAIGEAIIDQRNVAGIGNLYKSEALFLSGHHPWAEAHSADLNKVLTMARRLMLANVEHWSQTTTGDTRPGRRHWVFERSGKRCHRCGTVIESAEQGDPPVARLTYWCPSCQRPS